MFLIFNSRTLRYSNASSLERFDAEKVARNKISTSNEANGNLEIKRTLPKTSDLGTSPCFAIFMAKSLRPINTMDTSLGYQVDIGSTNLGGS